MFILLLFIAVLSRANVSISCFGSCNFCLADILFFDIVLCLVVVMQSFITYASTVHFYIYLNGKIVNKMPYLSECIFECARLSKKRAAYLIVFRLPVSTALSMLERDCHQTV